MTLNAFVALFSLVAIPSFAADVPIEGYSYSVTDISSRGLRAQDLFDQLPTSGMDLEHSICSHRSYVWSHQLSKKYKIQTGAIFIFFTTKVWEKQPKSYWYHAGTYVVENGKELVLEKSYPAEVQKPLSVIEWMDNEMEGRVPAQTCIELKKDQDPDLTEYFYGGTLLPSKRDGGKPSAYCYYRKIPGYYLYPNHVAMEEFQKDEDGKSIQYHPTGFDREQLIMACTDAYSGRKIFKRPQARKMCEKLY